jgi:hypothetical protein
MKLIILGLTIILFMTGCRESSSQNSASHNNGFLNAGVNPNSIAIRAQDKVQERKNKIELSQIDANAKIEIAKIESDNKLLIAKVNADAHKEVAKTDSNTKIQTSKIDAVSKKEDTQMTFYISIAVVVVIIIALILLFLNSKHNRTLKAKIHEEKLRQELDLKEKERHEQRLLKLLDLVADGKLPPQMEEEVILSLTSPTKKTIESKK